MVLDLKKGRNLIVSGKRSQVEVADQVEGLILNSEQDTLTADLEGGDNLQMMKPPSVDARGRVTWTGTNWC